MIHSRTYCYFNIGIALILGVSATLTFAEPLGRLFFTPEERTKMEKAKQGIPDEAPSTSLPPVERKEPFNGFVKRSDGQTTIWKGGKMQTQEKSYKSDISPKEVQTPNGIIAVPSRQSSFKHESPKY